MRKPQRGDILNETFVQQSESLKMVNSKGIFDLEIIKNRRQIKKILCLRSVDQRQNKKKTFGVLKNTRAESAGPFLIGYFITYLFFSCINVN